MKYLLLPFILSIVYGLLLISSRIMKQKKSLSDDLIQSYLFLLAICTTITGAVVGGLAAIGWKNQNTFSIVVAGELLVATVISKAITYHNSTAWFNDIKSADFEDYDIIIPQKNSRLSALFDVYWILTMLISTLSAVIICNKTFGLLSVTLALISLYILAELMILVEINKNYNKCAKRFLKERIKLK